jgi:hypothetical protein
VTTTGVDLVPPTADEAKQLARQTPVRPLLAVLKLPDNIAVLDRVLAGFQVKPENLKNPIALGRLASELAKNATLADAIRTVAATTKPDLPKPAPVAKVEQPLLRNALPQNKVDTARSELRALQREIKTMRAELLRAELGQRAARAFARTRRAWRSG